MSLRSTPVLVVAALLATGLAVSRPAAGQG